MRAGLIISFLLGLGMHLLAQEPETAPVINEQQLENLTENNEDIETEDDSYLQQMQQFLNNPINLNYASAAELSDLRILTTLQIENLIVYRSMLGNLLDIIELQAVPGWPVELIRRIKPFVTVAVSTRADKTIGARLSNGQHSLLLRVTQVLEKSKGYTLDASTANNFYPGSPQKLMIRYKYNYKNLLQYGVLGEKDAGEQFFSGRQKNGFDFYSAHFFVKDVGIVKNFALGDFTVNLGQGLTQWQSLAFKKSSEPINIKREASVLRPYNSPGEIFFHRGAGITLQKNRWQFTGFGSLKNIDANFVSDTSQNQQDYISSFQTSGYHRTKSEVVDKGVQQQLVFGGNLAYQNARLHIGLNAVQYHFKLPLTKSNDPYNKYALSGSNFGNYSVDYSYTYSNMHFFGEAAVTDKFKTAFINGLMMSVASKVDMSLLFRKISPAYQSLYTNAFTENSSPSNENGLFSGISIKPNNSWRIDAYMDIYSFPWLKFRVNAPTTGKDYLLQLTYKPNKQLEIYSRYHAESKAINLNPNDLTLSPVISQPRKNWRSHISYRISDALTLRNRLEMIWFDKEGAAPEQGFLVYTDVKYKPMMGRLSGSIRLQYFDTEGYNSRLYAYENDILYSFSIPVFYDKGYRYYINLNYDLNKKISFWLKASQYLYLNKSIIGSGLDEIKGSQKTEIKLQMLYKF